MFLINIIKKTNGDILGTILFLLLILYFIMLENKTIYTYLLLFGCVIGFAVDANITYKVIKSSL